MIRKTQAEKLGRLLSILSFLAAVLGCAHLQADYGTINPEREVTLEFETFKFDPDYQYFFSGSFEYPNALMGLKKGYGLEGNLWAGVKTTELTEMVRNMQLAAARMGPFQTVFGFAVRDGKGEKIGVWYSILSARTQVRIRGNTVVIPPPPLDTYERTGIRKSHPLPR